MKLRLKRLVLMAGRVKRWPLFRSNLDHKGGKSSTNGQSVELVTLSHNLLSEASNVFVTGVTSFRKPKRKDICYSSRDPILKLQM